MQISYKALALIIVAAAMVGGYIENAVTAKSKTKLTDKETETTDKNVTTIIKEHDNKDGSADKTTTIVDHSKIDQNTTIVNTTITTTPPKDWILEAGYDIQQTYRFGINRRILGPIYLGAFGDTKSNIGVSVAIQF